MAKLFRVDVVSPETVVWRGEAELLVARTTEGDIGIQADHEPTMAALSTGSAQIHTAGETFTVAVHGGFLQVYRNQVTLLSDRAEIVEGTVEDARTKAESLRAREAAEADGDEEESAPESAG